jgi:hypothetical protein
VKTQATARGCAPKVFAIEASAGEDAEAERHEHQQVAAVEGVAGHARRLRLRCSHRRRLSG